MLIDMEGFSVLLQRKSIKNINLRIQRSGEIHLSAPLKMSLQVIYNFLNTKRPWIELHQERLKKLETTRPQAEGIGPFLNFQGQTYPVQQYLSETKQQVLLRDKQIHLFIKPQAQPAEKQKLLKKWYQAQMEDCLPALLAKWQQRIGVTVNKISLKYMTSRWGSCNPTKKYISLNLKLIEKPLLCLEYVLVHELVHLLEPSHNHRFYAFMDLYLPEWRRIKKMHFREIL